MVFRTALISALAAVVVATTVGLLAGVLGGAMIDLPGVLELRSSTAGPPEAELWFNPPAPFVLVIVLAVVVRLGGRAVRS